jgi:glycosyltransferase involved in cell wall biosynthesis
VRILVVAEQYPWPAADGYRQRLHHLISGLARAGEVDVLALHRQGTAPAVPPPLEGVRVPEVLQAGEDAGLRTWAPRWVRGDMPRRVLGPDWGPVRAVLDDGRFRGGPRYDLVWCSHVDSWWALQDRLDGVPAIVDFDNLEHLALRLRRRVPPRFAPGAGAADTARTVARWAVSRGFDLVDERRWDRLQRRCARASARVVVCSELDLQRAGVANAVVVPNGCEEPGGDAADADRRGLRGASPTFLFVGALDYEPNTEAVEWFVREVLPLVRTRLPGATVRIVGRGGDSVAWVAAEPGVELVGSVDDLQVELAGADVSIVPIRVGAGTRLKVVEALANRLPLVTTTVGCEGIDVVDGVHALVADDAADFAAACVRLAGDGALRQRLADAGHELFAGHYDWDRIESQVAALAAEVVRSGGRG